MPEHEFTPDTEAKYLMESLDEEIAHINSDIEMLATRREIMTKWRDALCHGSTETMRLPPYPTRF